MAVKVYSKLYPELHIIDPPVRFCGGESVVSDEVAEQLSAFASIGVHTAEPLAKDSITEDSTNGVSVDPTDEDTSAEDSDLPLSGSRRRKR